MHSSQITHGTLAPENILITKDGKSNQDKWVIHFISWKNGKEHQTSKAIRKIHSRHVERKLERRLGKLKGRCAKTAKALHETVTDTPLTVRRKRCKTSKFGGGRKGKLYSIIKQNRIQRKNAVEADLRSLRDDVWK